MDPTSGEKLGSARKFVATVVVTTTESRFSRARLQKTEGVIEPGMVATVAGYVDHTGETAKKRKLPPSSYE